MAKKIIIKVSSKTERFRRAGMDFTREPREVEVDAKTLKILKDEPMLVVEQSEVRSQESGEKAK